MKCFYLLLALLLISLASEAQVPEKPGVQWIVVFQDDFADAQHTTDSWFFSHGAESVVDYRYDAAPLGENKALKLMVAEDSTTTFMRITAFRTDTSTAPLPAGAAIRDYLSGVLRLKPNSQFYADANSREPFAIHQGLFEIRCRMPR